MMQGCVSVWIQTVGIGHTTQTETKAKKILKDEDLMIGENNISILYRTAAAAANSGNLNRTHNLQIMTVQFISLRHLL